VHELGITQDLVDLVAARTVGRRVVAVNVRIGDAAGIVPDAMEFAFEVVTYQTALEGARLVIEHVAGDDLSLVSVELLKEPSCA
jgi:hydrogenase nickel incorporation protein HypA/HybF